jgi:predicted transcriptional regulator
MKKTVTRPFDKWAMLQRASLKYIKGNDLRVYADLLTYANDEGKCWPSVETIGKDLDMHPRNVQKHLANLEQDGWIEKHFRKDTSTEYQLYYVKVKDAEKPKTKKSNPSDGVVKSTVSGVAKMTVPGVVKTTVPGVADSTTLTDHLTDHNNIPIEQVDLVVNQGNQDDESTGYVCAPEERTEFDDLWKKYGVKGENRGSAYSAWKRYCAVGSERLLIMIKSRLDDSSGTYMTTQMKAAYSAYVKVLEGYENDRKLDEYNKMNPLQQL